MDGSQEVRERETIWKIMGEFYACICFRNMKNLLGRGK